MDKRTEIIEKLNKMKPEQINALPVEEECAINETLGLYSGLLMLSDNPRKEIARLFNEEADGWQAFVDAGKDRGIPGEAGYSSPQECKENAKYWRELAAKVKVKP